MYDGYLVHYYKSWEFGTKQGTKQTDVSILMRLSVDELYDLQDPTSYVNINRFKDRFDQVMNLFILDGGIKNEEVYDWSAHRCSSSNNRSDRR